jgi:hypothetical protein
MSESQEYRVRNSEGKTYAFTQWRQLSALAQHGRVDVDSELLLPGKRSWIPIRKIPKVAELVINALIDGPAAQAQPAQASSEAAESPPPQKRTAKSTGVRPVVAKAMAATSKPAAPKPKPSNAPKARAAAKAPPSRSRTRRRATGGRVARRPASVAATETPAAPKAAPPAKPAAANRAAGEQPKPAPKAEAGKPAAAEAGPEKTEKPAALAVVPALLSLVPGLGQAYNLNIKKAFFFAIAFLAGLGIAIFKPLVGLPLMAAAVFLAMSDAYGTALGKGLFGGLWRGGWAAVRFYFAAFGVLVWAVTLTFAVDSLACWLGSGTQMASTISLDASGAASRDWSQLLVSVAAIVGAIALFSVHAAGRRFVWARQRPAPILATFRTAFLGGLVAGLFSVLVSSAEAQTGEKLVTGALHLPAGVAIFEPFDALRGIGAGIAASFTSHPLVYKFVLLAGLAGFLPLIFFRVARTMREMPGFGEWLEFWRAGTRERTAALKSDLEKLRADRAAAWKRRRELLDARHREQLRARRATENRLARLESMTESLARKAGVEVPPSAEATSAEDLGGEGAPLSFAEKLGVIASALWGILTGTCLPALAGGARKVARGTSAAAGKVAGKLKRKKKAEAPAAGEGEKAEAAEEPEKREGEATPAEQPAAEEKADETPAEPAAEPSESEEQVQHAEPGAEVEAEVEAEPEAETAPGAEEAAPVAAEPEPEPTSEPEPVEEPEAAEAPAEVPEVAEVQAEPIPEEEVQPGMFAEPEEVDEVEPAAAAEAEIPSAADAEVLEPIDVEEVESVVEAVDASVAEPEEVPDDAKDETQMVKPVN